MPCYSSVQTKMTDGKRIQEALTALGYKVSVSTDGAILGRHVDLGSIQFNKGADAYSATGSTDHLSPIAKRYAEIGVREFAKRRGFSITSNDGTRVEMVQRRR